MFRPDLTIILDLPVEEGLRRAAGRGGAEDRYERMGIDFHQRLRQGFLDIAHAEPARCTVVSAQGTLDEVQQRILSVVSQRFDI